MLEILSQFQLSILAIVAMLALTLNIYLKEEIYSFSNRLYKAMLLNTVLVMILEMLSWAFDLREGSVMYTLNYGFNFLLFIFSTAVPGFWASYIDYKIFGDEERIKRRVWYMYPFIISLTLGIINIFTPIVFYVTSDNVFTRLPLVFVNFIMVYILLFHALIQVIRHRKELRQSTVLSVVMFLILPAIASVIQYFNYGLILMWSVMGLTLLIVYLFLETTSNAKDYLTGLYNRSKIDEFVEHQVKQDEEFSLIMIDLDNYKKINDTHGHQVGDQTIITFGKLLSTVFGKEGLIARYGGDEFIVLYFGVEDHEIEESISVVKKRIEEYDDEVFSQVKFSYGYASRTVSNQKDYQRLLVESDDLMYQNKAINKNFKRRSSDR